ncbi:O-antigen ligase family protein [Amnibacterium flavum]|uniref:Exopolysaccharide production protein n=1 Tax=Amnibacterium flavum TaxID=2173173 RepID=A0A2V1HYJ6_9MICO|nr:O-antigen ligase family protein [Amnibacterium flavum]PVZ95877.1 exopolysaccharide production protein [Amnibacterium flavum]
MNSARAPRHPHLRAVVDVLESPRFSAVLATVSIGTVLLTHAVRSMIGWPGLIAALATLAVMAGAVLYVRRDQFEWLGILPVTLLAFVGWSIVSTLWSQYQWTTVSGVLYQVVVGLLAVFVAIGRDLIQIVRAFGDVFRLVLGVSLAVEILSGIIFDVPIKFLGVLGNIAIGGPIQGLMGSRNMLGLITLIAVITFAVESGTRSVRRETTIASLVLAGVVFVLTRSPVASFAGLVVALAAVALLLIRRTPAERRQGTQIGFGILAVVAAAVAYFARGPIVGLFNAGGELQVRLSLWRQTWALTQLHFTEGWGWAGSWRPDVLPFLAIRTTNGRIPTSALDAYIDVWFQLGLIGLVIFVAFLGLALTRSWIVASNRRNVAHVWPALVLVALAFVSAAESAILTEWGWFLFVVCAVKAAQELSWRRGLRRTEVG